MFGRKSDVSDNNKANKEIMAVTYIFVGIFILLISYIFYFTAFRSESFINNPYNNKRAQLLSEKIVRGTVYSRNGEILARTDSDENGNEKRVYPYGPVFAHAVGFFSQGSTGVESIASFKLLTSNDSLKTRVVNDLTGVKNKGDCVVTTLDTSLQSVAWSSLGDRKGAVVVINVKTGEILALVSKPDFDPNRIDEIWDAVNEDTESSPLLNRVTQGLYPPGSTFKIMTALEFIKENPDTSGYAFDCHGSFLSNGVKISCYHGTNHGELDFDSSFARSCNSSFANISSTLDKEKFGRTCTKLLFNSELPCPYNYKSSYVDMNSDTGFAELIQAGIGQGRTQITPMHMAMITSAIANNGMLMKPIVISSVKNIRGASVRTYSFEEYGRLLNPDESEKLRELMRQVVLAGTGSRLQGTMGYEAAGKTGSAEYSVDKTKSHAWFTGFAPYDDPEIAVTVIVEGGGSGGETAVPIARMVFDEYFND
ncbi:MAG: penicillin-binding protein 2 [Lachnospiraceae bacterium]|nr:penicillin-binding protein 2 [Lachnospiraceae bacterium]